MDDGWFGKRNNDRSSLGDWYVNEEKLKGGLGNLIPQVKEQGLKFGIWYEPEMVNPTSDLYKILSVPVKFGKTYTISMNSELPVETILVIYGEKGLSMSKTNNLNNISEDTTNKSTYKKFNRLQFNRPNMIHTKSWHQLYNSYYVGKYGKIDPYNKNIGTTDDTY
jgi:hypothetical protein